MTDRTTEPDRHTRTAPSGPDRTAAQPGVDRFEQPGVDRLVVRADAKIRTADAQTDRVLRTERERTVLAREERRARQEERTDRRRSRQAEKAERTGLRTERRRARATRRRAQVVAVVDYVARNSVAVYSSGIYSMALAGAVYGQVTAAMARGWPLLAGVAVAAGIEGLALVMALTAHQLRLQRERALVPRALTWLCALSAAAINYGGHADQDLVGAALLAMLSLAAIVVWEIRSGAKHRAELRRKGQIPPPAEQWGWRRWLRHPRSTFAGWSADIRTRLSARAAELLQVAEAERHARRIERQRRRLMRTARIAAWRGKPGPVLEAIEYLVRTGPAMVPQAPGTGQPGPDRQNTSTTKRTARDRSGPQQTEPEQTEPEQTEPEQTDGPVADVMSIDRTDSDWVPGPAALRDAEEVAVRYQANLPDRNELMRVFGWGAGRASNARKARARQLMEERQARGGHVPTAAAVG